MGDDHRRVEIALEKAGEPPSLVIRQTEPWVELDGDLTPNLEAAPISKLGYLLALSFDGDESSNTIIIMTHFEFIYSNFTVAIHFPDGWLMLDGQHLTENAVCYLSVMERALRLLAHPSVRYVMRQPTPGMAKMSKNRERKGEEPVADMKIVHLTKRIYIDGRPVGGKGGSHASPKPHDREGHYRTRATPLPGWEGPFTPVSGDFKGQVRYRRWFDKTTVNGGAPDEKPGRGHPKAALPKAPQYRVVK